MHGESGPGRNPNMRLRVLLSCLGATFAVLGAPGDWTRFRGPDGAGISEAKGTPLRWSDAEGILWKTDLPGPGASSPVVFGERIFLTHYSGFGPGITGGHPDSLKRHLLCLDRKTGKILWETAVAAELPEQERIREDHGYATATPVVDAERVYVFWGRSGAFAFDHGGKQLWKAKVGSELNGWGSAASPVLHGELLLLNAYVESKSFVALDRTTGREVWRSTGIGDSWHAPAVVTLPDGKAEIIAAMSQEVRGLDAVTGAELWKCRTGNPWYVCPTPVTRDGTVYLIAGRGPNVTMAVRAGGRGDVSSSHVRWKTGKGSNVPSPVLHGGHLYFAHENLGVVLCVNAENGEVVFEERLNPNPGQIYASPVLADGKLYFLGRGGVAVVLAAEPQFRKLADNRLENGRGVFNATPAFDGRRLLIRSNRALYCLGEN